MTALTIAAAALALEAAVGWPAALHKRLSHPVVWIGTVIGLLEQALNDARLGEGVRRVLGVVTLLLVVWAAGGAGLTAEGLVKAASAQADWPGAAWIAAVAIAALATTGLAYNSLMRHVRAVADPLIAGDLAAAQSAVAMIVGRDVDALDAQGVAAAAVESLAESFCDGVAAPLLWLAAFGLPGLFVYKAVNTADSMIGHREARWRAFGWASARLDDVMNLIPARLSGALIALAGGRGWRVMLRDAHRHASPNAGWPEAAMAGALKVRLGGPAVYDGVQSARPVLGEGPDPVPADLLRAMAVVRRAWRLLLVLMVAAALIFEVGGSAWPF